MENGRSCCSWIAATPFPLRTLPRSRFAQSTLTTKLPRSVTPRRLHAHMVQYGVDFIGGNFNMSAFSIVRDVFSDPEFAAPGNALLWGIGGVDDTCKDCTGFLIMPKRPRTWRVHAHGCYKFDNAALPCLPSPSPTSRDSRQHLAQFSRSETSPGACCWQKRPHRSTQAARKAIFLEPSGHAAQVQFLTALHTTSATAFCQHRPNAKTPCSGFHAAPHRERPV